MVLKFLFARFFQHQLAEQVPRFCLSYLKACHRAVPNFLNGKSSIHLSDHKMIINFTSHRAYTRSGAGPERMAVKNKSDSGADSLGPSTRCRSPTRASTPARAATPAKAARTPRSAKAAPRSPSVDFEIGSQHRENLCLRTHVEPCSGVDRRGLLATCTYDEIELH